MTAQQIAADINAKLKTRLVRVKLADENANVLYGTNRVQAARVKRGNLQVQLTTEAWISVNADMSSFVCESTHVRTPIGTFRARPE